MSAPRHGVKLWIGGAAVALTATLGFGFTTPPTQEQLPTVQVWHDPT